MSTYVSLSLDTRSVRSVPASKYCTVQHPASVSNDYACVCPGDRLTSFSWVGDGPHVEGAIEIVHVVSVDVEGHLAPLTCLYGKGEQGGTLIGGEEINHLSRNIVALNMFHLHALVSTKSVSTSSLASCRGAQLLGTPPNPMQAPIASSLSRAPHLLEQLQVLGVELFREAEGLDEGCEAGLHPAH